MLLLLVSAASPRRSSLQQSTTTVSPCAMTCCLPCSGINKPVAVLDWLQKVDVKEDYVLIIDADMIMRAPVIPADLGAEPGEPCHRMRLPSSPTVHRGLLPKSERTHDTQFWLRALCVTSGA